MTAMLGRILYRTWTGCNPHCRSCSRPRYRNKAMRAREKAETVEDLDVRASVETHDPLVDTSDCRHGCNGICNPFGQCTFLCHDRETYDWWMRH